MCAGKYISAPYQIISMHEPLLYALYSDYELLLFTLYSNYEFLNYYDFITYSLNMRFHNGIIYMTVA